MANPTRPPKKPSRDDDLLHDPAADKDAWVDEDEDEATAEVPLDLPDLLAEDDPLLDESIDDDEDSPQLLDDDEVWEEDEEVEELDDDDDGSAFEDEFDDLFAEELDALPGELVVLPWRLTAQVTDLGQVPAVLDPTAATTTLNTPDASGETRKVALTLGRVEVVADVATVAGPLGLRVGRDILAGRIAVDSG